MVVTIYPYLNIPMSYVVLIVFSSALQMAELSRIDTFVKDESLLIWLRIVHIVSHKCHENVLVVENKCVFPFME